ALVCENSADVAPRSVAGEERCEHVKPLDGIQLVRIQPGQRCSEQAGSESCTCVGGPTRGSGDTQGSGPRGFSSEIVYRRGSRRCHRQRKAVSREPIGEARGNRRSSSPGATSHEGCPRTGEAYCHPP